ncbi:MAG: hypothetical protein VX519_03290, partial [Myxococcota bacterium]|nr:hypothetical protein [Myxococcota bacterium]
AAARVLLSREPAGELDLEGWVVRLNEFLGAQGVRMNSEGVLGTVVDYWPVDEEGESEREARVYLDGSRRMASSDAQMDARICILEAAARTQPPQRDLLEEGVSSSDEAVRWTATRLLGVLEGRREAGGATPWGNDHWSELPASAVGTHHDDPNYGSNPPVPGLK